MMLAADAGYWMLMLRLDAGCRLDYSGALSNSVRCGSLRLSQGLAEWRVVHCWSNIVPDDYDDNI